MYKLVLAGGVTLLMAACATVTPPKAQTTAATQQQTLAVTRGTADSGQQLICTDSYPLGSHIPQRICLTKEQMAARQKAAQDALRNLQIGPGHGSTSCAPNCLMQ